MAFNMLHTQIYLHMKAVTCFIFLTWTSEHLFNLKFAAKELERNAKKCEKEEKVEKVKLKKVRNSLFRTFC